MVIWFIVEAVVSAVGVYNITRGVYNMYCDAEKVKKEYRKHQRTAEEYCAAQIKASDQLSESQFHQYENNFILLNQSTIMRDYTPPDVDQNPNN